jgi:urease accessory protein
MATIMRLTTTTTTSVPTEAISPAALLRLLQLASPALPIGAFAYSQGLEAAVARGAVTDEAGAAGWVVGILRHGLGTLDVPVFARILAAWSRVDAGEEVGADEVWRLSAWLRAARGSAELAAEDRRLGGALARALVTLGVEAARPFQDDPRATQAASWALAARAFSLPAAAAAAAQLFAWAENATAAAVRLVPLGQSAGLRIVAAAAEAIPAVVERGLALADDDIGAATPGQALLAAWHETQYSRLFRS